MIDMKTIPKEEATKTFAKMYLNLEEYFYKIAPKKDVVEPVRNNVNGWVTWEDESFTKFDEYGSISLPAPQPPVSLDEFQKAGEEFISELNENVMNYSDEINRAILNVAFCKIKSGIVPTYEMLIRASLFTTALLLEKFLDFRTKILNLQSYSNSILWPENGMEDYRESLKQTNIAKRGALSSKPQQEVGNPEQKPATPRIEVTPLKVKVAPKGQPFMRKECLQEENSAQTKGRGRPKKPFKDMMINDTNGGKLQKIHDIMKGKKGKGAALIILAAVKKGWLQKPTYPQVADEFGNIGAKQGFTAYLHEEKFTKNEIEGAMKSLEQA